MNDETSTSSHSWDKNVISSQNVASTSLHESVALTKKDISYIFKLDATKKKLENINKKIEKFYNKSIDLTAEMAEKNRVYLIFEKSYYETELKYQELLSAFHQSLTLHGLTTIDPVINHVERDTYLKSLAGDTERKNMATLLDGLFVSFLDTGIPKSVCDDLSQKMDALHKDIADLNKQFDANKKLMDQEDINFDQVNTEWLLKSYEMSSMKTSIDDLIAHPQIETQLKKLIAMYTNKSEMIKFWLTVPKGILLVGEPHTGKSFVVRVLASEIDRKVYHIKAHDLFSEDVTDPNEMLYTIFYNIIVHVQKTKAPCIIFLDEIENIISSVWEFNPALEKMIANTLIKNITNIQKSGLDIVVLAALSHKNKLDERFLKYDLFDNQFFFELPQDAQRKRLFTMNIERAEKLAKLALFSPEIVAEMLDELVKKTEGFSAEYIKQLITACVKEYSYNYLQKKSWFALEEEFISASLATINDNKDTWNSLQNTLDAPLSLQDRKKLLYLFVAEYTQKELSVTKIFGSKKEELLKYILAHTEGYTTDTFSALIKICVDEYQRKKSDYHKNHLIQKEFILEKINELRMEDRSKGKGAYFHNF